MNPVEQATLLMAVGAEVRQSQETTLKTVGGQLRHLKGDVERLAKGVDDAGTVAAAVDRLTQAVRSCTQALELLLEREAAPPKIEVTVPERGKRAAKITFSDDGESATVTEE